MTPLVSTAWLAENLQKPELVVCDCSFYLPTDPRNAAALFAEARIPGARFFDIDAIKDTTSDLPHMLPSAETFAEMVGALGISNTSTVIFYDQVGLFSAARGWWMMRVFGHDRAAVLDGGLPKWRAENHPLETGAPVLPSPTVFRSAPRPELVRDLADDERDHRRGFCRYSGCTPAGRFAGTAPEPRPGIRGGHMPGAHSIPFNQLAGRRRYHAAARPAAGAFCRRRGGWFSAGGDQLRHRRDGGGVDPGSCGCGLADGRSL